MKTFLIMITLLVTIGTAMAASQKYYEFADATALNSDDRLLVFQSYSGGGVTRNVTGAVLKSSVLGNNQTAPVSATATGTAGEIRFDANYMYRCTATNTWKRTPLSTW